MKKTTLDTTFFLYIYSFFEPYPCKLWTVSRLLKTQTELLFKVINLNTLYKKNSPKRIVFTVKWNSNELMHYEKNDYLTPVSLYSKMVSLK